MSTRSVLPGFCSYVASYSEVDEEEEEVLDKSLLRTAAERRILFSMLTSVRGSLTVSLAASISLSVLELVVSSVICESKLERTLSLLVVFLVTLLWILSQSLPYMPGLYTGGFTSPATDHSGSLELRSGSSSFRDPNTRPPTSKLTDRLSGSLEAPWITS